MEAVPYWGFVKGVVSLLLTLIRFTLACHTFLISFSEMVQYRKGKYYYFLWSRRIEYIILNKTQQVVAFFFQVGFVYVAIKRIIRCEISLLWVFNFFFGPLLLFLVNHFWRVEQSWSKSPRLRMVYLYIFWLPLFSPSHTLLEFGLMFRIVKLKKMKLRSWKGAVRKKPKSTKQFFYEWYKVYKKLCNTYLHTFKWGKMCLHEKYKLCNGRKVYIIF